MLLAHRANCNKKTLAQQVVLPALPWAIEQRFCWVPSNTEILYEAHVKLLTSIGYCLQLLWIWLVEIVQQKKTYPLKTEFKYILFPKQRFCRFMHSLCKNENTPMWGKSITP